MEWTKIKAKHFLYSDLTLLDRGALATLLLLAAHLERTPTPREVRRHVADPSLRRLQGGLQATGTTLAGVYAKVLEDVQGIEHKKAVSRGTSKRYREKPEPEKSVGDTSHDTTEKRREEKRREEKNIKAFFCHYLERTKKKFKLTPDKKKLIKDGFKSHSLDEMKKAVDNFVLDEWEGRINHMDLIYCIGIRNKINNLDKWLNKDPKAGKSEAVRALEEGGFI